MFFTNPESTNQRFFFTKFYVSFLRGQQSVFFCNNYDKHLQPVRDIKKRIIQFSKSSIANLKCCIKATEPFKTPF